MNSTGGSWTRLVMVVAGVVCVGLVCGLAVALTSASLLRAELQAARVELEQAQSAKTAVSPDRVEALEKLLREQTAAYAQLQGEFQTLSGQATVDSAPVAAASLPLPAPAAPTAPTPGAWLERMRTEDPERYRQLQEERERRRERMDAFFHEQLDRLDERYNRAGTPDEANVIEQIAGAVSKLDELRQQWPEVRELPEAERREAARQLGEESRATFQRLAELRGLDRELQLNQLATQLGYSGGHSVQFVDRVKSIIRETEAGPMPFMGGRGGGGGR